MTARLIEEATMAENISNRPCLLDLVCEVYAQCHERGQSDEKAWGEEEKAWGEEENDV